MSDPHDESADEPTGEEGASETPASAEPSPSPFEEPELEEFLGGDDTEPDLILGSD